MAGKRKMARQTWSQAMRKNISLATKLTRQNITFEAWYVLTQCFFPLSRVFMYVKAQILFIMGSPQFIF